MGTLSPCLIEWGVASRALPDQRTTGDDYLVRTWGNGALVAVADGLGHGAGAASAANAAMRILEKSEREAPLAMIGLCHEGLRSTRGVVMSLARFNGSDHTMTWLGVGNVEGFLLHRDAQVVPGDEALILRAGVVGDRLPRLSASVLQVGFGDLLIFATDGIRPGFADNLNLDEPPQRVADRILAQFGRETDDALALVVRYLNGKRTNATR